MDDEREEEGFRRRISRQGEEALGRLAEELASNSLVAGAVGRAVGAREKALQAQEAAMGVLGVPSAADVERLTRRLRSVSQRLEGIEDLIDGLDERLASIQGSVERLDETAETDGARPAEASTSALEARLEAMATDLASVREAVGAGPDIPSRSQERLAVGDSAA